MSLSRNPLQPSAACVPFWAAICFTTVRRVFRLFVCILYFCVTFFLAGECLPNFVCPFPWHMRMVCNPLQPNAVCVLCWAATCWFYSVCVSCYFVYLVYFHTPEVPNARNFYKFLCLIYMHLSVACNPWQPFSHPRNVWLDIALCRGISALRSSICYPLPPFSSNGLLLPLFQALQYVSCFMKVLYLLCFLTMLYDMCPALSSFLHG